MSSNLPRPFADREGHEERRTSSIASSGSTSCPLDTSKISPSASSNPRNIRQPRLGSTEDLSSRRRSSISMRISSFRQMGGPNSLDNFARSWQRAAAFHEIAPLHRSSVVLDDGGDDLDPETQSHRHVRPHMSMLRQQFESGGGHGDYGCAVEDSPVDSPGRRVGGRPFDRRLFSDATNSLLSPSGLFPTSPGHGFGTSCDTVSSRIQESSRQHAARVFHDHYRTRTQEVDRETEPLLVKQAETEEGLLLNVAVGQSTLPQTVCNSVNIMIGVGLLSLPLGLKYSGWVLGSIFLCFAAWVTSYTAKILARCLDVDSSLLTYADLAYVSFGPRFRIATGFLFSIELLATCVALVVLFADSLNALMPAWSITDWKILCGVLLIPLNFAPLRVLSFSSILGILCCTTLVIVVIVDGFIKSESPGSLRHPALTHLFPEDWMTLPLALGILMSPWGGHTVFPSIYRDMRHPQKFKKNIDITYSVTFGIDMTMAVVGFLMFGDYVREEVTSSILLTEGYPRGLSLLIVSLVAIIPITKIPLNCRPIISTLEVIWGVNSQLLAPGTHSQTWSPLVSGILKVTARLLVVIVVIVLAIVFPDFDSIMALMGSTLCFTICIILPLAFYLKIFGDEIPLNERVLAWVLIVVSSIFATIGTVWALLPKEMVVPS